MPDRPAVVRNARLETLSTAKAITPAGREVEFRASVSLTQMELSVLGPLKLEIDGRPIRDIPAANPIRFRQSFPVGSHLVTLRLPNDADPSDNRQDFALDVLPAIPVLIVDGDPGESPGSRFLRAALAPTADPTPAFAVRTATSAAWPATWPSEDIRGPSTPPRVLVLANVDKPTADQVRQIEQFLGAGGSVLALLGDRVDANSWNETAFRAGRGFLPARLIEPAGIETDGTPRTPLVAGFAHPALDIFKEPLPGGLQAALFPRRWTVDINAGINGSTGAPIALFNDRTPFLVERSFGAGRVILATHPLDRSWNTNLHRLPDFVRLAHELLYYLAGSRAGERNLQSGQSIIYSPQPEESPGVVVVHPPAGPVRSIPCPAWPAVIGETHQDGAYRVVSPGGRTTWFSVRPDPRESNLATSSPEERDHVTKILPTLLYVDAPKVCGDGAGDGPPTREVWWLLLGVFIGFLILETANTRKLVRRGIG